MTLPTILPKDDTVIVLPKIEVSLKDAKAWMTNNVLLLTTEITDVIIVGP